MTRLTTREQQKYIAVKEYVAGKITRKQASIRLGISPDAVTRMKKGYLEKGKDHFMHGNRSNSNARRIDTKVEKEILYLYEHDFKGFNFTHFRESLLDFRLIDSSRLPSQRSIASILERNGIRSPVANRVRRDPNPHPTRPRREASGDLVQVDASEHDWLGLGPDKKITLHSGIDILTTSSPQAKGRVERLFRTLQDRLLSELRYYNITSVEEANLFLPDYIRRHNEKFGLKSDSIPNGFKSLSYEQRADLDKILSVKEARRVLSGNVISFGDKQYMPVDESNCIVKLPLNDAVEVLRTLNGDLLLLHDVVTTR